MMLAVVALLGIAGIAGFLLYRQFGTLTGELVRAGSIAQQPTTAPPIYPTVTYTQATPAGGSGTFGIRNNNPGNIRDAGIAWQGMTGTANGFVVFATPIDGLRAIARELMTSFKRGQNTVQSIISEWAPPKENNTNKYITSVSKITGYAPTQALAFIRGNVGLLMRAIVFNENGSDPYTVDQYDAALTAAGM